MSWQNWSAEDVANWTREIGVKYNELADAFLEAGVDGSFLSDIEDTDLQELGLNSGFLRKRFNHKLNVLRASTNTGGGEVSSPSPVVSKPIVPPKPKSHPAPPAPILPSPPQRKSHPKPPSMPGVPPAPKAAPGAPPAAPGSSKVGKRISALQRQFSGAKLVQDKSKDADPPKPPAAFASMKRKLSTKTPSNDDPFADYSAVNLKEALNKKTEPKAQTSEPGVPPPKPVVFNAPPPNPVKLPPKPAAGVPGAPGMKTPPPAPPKVRASVAARAEAGGDSIPPPPAPNSIPPPPSSAAQFVPPPAPGAGPGAPPPAPGALPGAPPGAPPGSGGLFSLPPPPPRASVASRPNAPSKSIEDTPDLPDFLDDPGAPPGAGPGVPGVMPMPTPDPVPNPGATPGGPGMAMDAVAASGNADYDRLHLERPTNTESAAMEFSTSIAICCASLQLNIEHLELLINIATRLEGRDQVKLDLTNAKITRDLTTHEEFLQVCYLIGFELDESGETLFCQQPPPDDILKVFNDIVKEFQYSGPGSYSVKEHVNDLSRDEIDILKIVIALTHEYTQQSEDAVETLVSFLTYLTDFPTFLKILRCWFEWCDARNDRKVNRVGNVRYKIATIVKYLLKVHRVELTGDDENVALQELLDVIKSQDLIAFSHIQGVIRQSNAAMNMPDDVIEGAAAEKIELLQLKPEILANQLSILDQKLFSHISSREIFEHDLNDSVLAEFIQRYSNIVRWIQLAVYCESNLENRAQRIRWVFKVAETLLNNRNYFSFQACLDALDSPEIQAFEPSWTLVNKKKWSSKRDYAKLNAEWQKYRDPSHLSECFWEVEAPAVPPYRVVLKNSIVKDEYRDQAQSTVEAFCLYRKLWPLASLVRTLQTTRYELDTNMQIQHALEVELRVQAQLKSQDISMLFLQALNTDGLQAPVGVSGPRQSMIR